MPSPSAFTENSRTSGGLYDDDTCTYDVESVTLPQSLRTYGGSVKAKEQAIGGVWATRWRTHAPPTPHGARCPATAPGHGRRYDTGAHGVTFAATSTGPCLLRPQGSPPGPPNSAADSDSGSPARSLPQARADGTRCKRRGHRKCNLIQPLTLPPRTSPGRMLVFAPRWPGAITAASSRGRDKMQEQGHRDWDLVHARIVPVTLRTDTGHNVEPVFASSPS